MYAALITDFELLDATALAALSQEERTAITVGLTRAMVGAKTEEVLALPGLKTIASIGAGIDKFDFPWLAERGISVHPTPDIMTEDTAEFAVGLVFAAFRNIVGNDRLVRRGDWAIKGRAAPGKRISGSKIGIVGLGRIGSRIATKLSAIGCEVSYTGTTKKDVDWQFVPNLADMATAVDALILSCVGGDATRGLISADVLDRLGPDGFVINVARGSVVNEEALINALQTEVIAGAALDVFENEPSPDPRFYELGNCILQPHTSVFTNENRRDLAQELTRLLQLK
jgi:lactate dehydrogenase-like 2-hydroxyacid dehydrogenase